MEINEKGIQKVLDNADRQRAINQYLQKLLYNKAKEINVYSTWLIEYPPYEEKVGFEFKIEVTSEDKLHQIVKTFYVGYDWEEEKQIMKEIIEFLLNKIKKNTTKK